MTEKELVNSNDEDDVRVGFRGFTMLTTEFGRGGFGMKIHFLPFVLILWIIF